MEKGELCVMACMGINNIKGDLVEGKDPDQLFNGWIDWLGTELVDELESILACCHYRRDVVEAVSREFNLQPNEAMWLALGLVYGASIVERNPQVRKLLFEGYDYFEHLVKTRKEGKIVPFPKTKQG